MYKILQPIQLFWRHILAVLLVLGPGILWASDEYVLMEAAETATVHRIYSLDDNNQVSIPTGSQAPPVTPSGVLPMDPSTDPLVYKLNKGDYFEVYTEFQSLGDSIKADRAVSIGTHVPVLPPGATAVSNQWVNKNMAGTQFAIPHLIEPQDLKFYPLSKSALVTIDLQGDQQQIPILEGQVVTFSINTGSNYAVKVVSDEPILVSHTIANHEIYAVPPATRSLWGARGNDVIVAALENATIVNITTDDGTTEGFQIEAGETRLVTIGSALTQGQGSVLAITADKPIAAVQLGDGDGQSYVPFASQASLASLYLISSDTQYVIAICPQVGTTIRLYGQGLVPEEKTCTGTPGKAYFGSPFDGVQVPEGSWLESEDPVLIITETVNTNKEVNRRGLINNYYLLDPDSGVAEINVTGLSNDTWVMVGTNEYQLDQGEQLVIPAGTIAQGDVLRSSDDISVLFDHNELVQPASERLLGTDFVIPHIQGDHTYYFLSPHHDTEITLTISTNSSVIQLIKGQVLAYPAGSDNSVAAQVRTDSPILLGHKAALTKKVKGKNVITSVDAYIVAPVAKELWGVRTKKSYLGALENATNINVWASNSATKTYSLNAGQVIELKVGRGTSQGKGVALHVVADKPVAAIQFNDSDGDSISAFWPQSLLDNRFILPLSGQYVTVVCPTAGSTLTITQPGQTGVVSVCSASGDDPGVNYFGGSKNGSHLLPATAIESDQPVFILYEPSNSDTETNLTGSRSKIRPRIPFLDSVPPTISQLPLDITGTGESNVGILVYINGAISELTTADASGAFLVSLATLIEGDNEIHVVANNQVSKSAPSNVEVVAYNLLPDAPVLDTAPLSVRNESYLVTGTSTPNIEIRLHLNTILVATLTADAAGFFQSGIVLNSGDNTIFATAWDGSLESEASNTLLINYLPPPPAPVINQPSSPVTIDIATVTGTAAASDEVRLFVGGILQTSVTADGAGQFSAQVNLQSGVNQIQATDWDGEAESELSNTVVVDYQVPIPPNPPVLDVASSPTNTSPISISGIAPLGLTSVRIYLNGLFHTSVTADGAGVFIAQVSLQSGSNTIHATSWDGSLENVVSNILTVDYQPIILPTTPILDLPISPTNNNPYTLTGVTDPTISVNIYLGGELEATVLSDGAGIFSTSLALLDGLNTVFAISNNGQLSSDPSVSIEIEYINNLPRLQSGTITQDIVWTKGDGTAYSIDGDFTVASGVKLIIQPGVLVEFIDDYSFTVDGSLVIQGTSIDPVVFTSGRASPGTSNWQGIIITSTAVDVLIDYALIEYADMGVRFNPGSSGTVNNSVIQLNRYGVFVQGDNNVVNNPQPLVTGNSIYANTNQNYYTTSFGDAANVVLDATGNWWGTLDRTVIAQKIHDHTDSAASPWVDYGQYLDGVGGNSLFTIYDVGIVDARINQHPSSSDEATLTFTTNTPTSSTLEVYQVDSTTLLYTESQVHSVHGTYNYTWDGRDQFGAILPDDAYKLVLTVTDGTNQFVWDPVASGVGSGSGIIPATYNTFQNDYWKINYSLAAAGLVQMRVTPAGGTAFYPINIVPYGAGNHLLIWDGRDQFGDIVTGGVNIYFPPPTNMKPNSVIVRGGTPTITGNGLSPNIEVKSDPYYITHSYDQFTNITYRIDQDSTVTFKLLPPGVSDPASPAAIVLVDNQLQTALDAQSAPIDHIVEWRGYDMADTNNIQVSEEGAYTFTIEAASVSSGQSTLYRGVVQIGQ